ncbi:MAG: hypothetical protein AABO41_26395 [Acidobacteriota bacterium]
MAEKEAGKRIHKFFSPLRTRDGLANAEGGRWKEDVNLSHIATLAKNLDTSRATSRQDKLHSVPSPWARALLFESALYDPGHPAHTEVTDQWRGLLGLLALADALQLSERIRVENVDLDSQPQGELRDAFISLRPRHFSEQGDLEDGRWARFGMIFFDDILVGSSSPRTIVFTSISHEKLRGIAFLSKEGRLDDPTKYLRQQSPELLGILRTWLDELIAKVDGNDAINRWMGVRPADPNANPVSRSSRVLIALQRWRDSIQVESGIETLKGESWRLPEPWSIIEKAIDLPAGLSMIHNPQAYLERALIEVTVAPDAVYAVLIEGRHYLLPFTKGLVDLLTYDQLVEAAQRSRITRTDSETLSFQTEAQCLGRMVRLERPYKKNEIISNADGAHPTQRLAMWPDFVVDAEGHEGANLPRCFDSYFFYTSDVAAGQVVFSPVGDVAPPRSFDESNWYVSRVPIKGFVGAVEGKSGFLLIRRTRRKAPTKLWKVGVDFGSTHTSAFYTEVHERDGQLQRDPHSSIRPLAINPRVKILTHCDQFQIMENFFLWNPDGLTQSTVASGSGSVILTQLALPMKHSEKSEGGWLPREGQVYLASILVSWPEYLQFDLKWNRDTKDYSTRAFLRSLMTLLKAEAASGEASIAQVSHSYPSSFPKDLQAKHTGEWTSMISSVGVRADGKPLTEAVAVCRQLRAEQNAYPASNVIALDIGGSTTDLALWADRSLKIQESVKMAAGMLSRYIELNQGFRSWFIQRASDVPFELTRLSLLTPERVNRRVFHSALNRLTQLNLIDSFIEVVQADKSVPAVKGFLSYTIFLFSALSYFAGLIARRAQMETIDQYYLFFCGRGGQFFRWIPKAEKIVEEAFNAGRVGPGAGKRPSNVVSTASKYPKQEAGRGLLVDYHQLTVDDGRGRTTGALDEPNETVTAAEEGYLGFRWNSELTSDADTYQKLKRAVERPPKIEHLKEMNCFVKSFCDSTCTSDIAKNLGVSISFQSAQYRDVLHERLLDNLADGSDRALIEPFFITEVKALVQVLFKASLDFFD